MVALVAKFACEVYTGCPNDLSRVFLLTWDGAEFSCFYDTWYVCSPCAGA